MAGILLDDGPTNPCKVSEIKRGCYEFTLIEGKNRQIRRMVEWCGTHVARLKRVVWPACLGALLRGSTGGLV